MVSEVSNPDREVDVLRLLSQGPASHPGKKHIVQLLDHFEHSGPNGVHRCLVLELLGSSIPTEAEHYKDNRLPGAIARQASRQTVQALDYIHASGIAHGGQSSHSPVHTWLITDICRHTSG